MFFFDGEGENFDGLLESPNFFKYMLLLHDIENSPVIVKENIFYSIDYKAEMISFNNVETDEKEEFKFEDIEKTKNVLGNIYDIYLEVKKYNVNVTNIKEYGDIYIVYYYDETKSYVSIMDDKKNIIKTYDEFDALDDVYYAYGDYIYIMSKNNAVDVYKKDGTFFNTYNITSEYVSENLICDGLRPVKMLVDNEKLFIYYILIECSERKEFNDVNSILKEDSELDEPLNYLTQVFEMDYDISTGDTKNGTVTYESKEDKDGKKYIELKITPEKGYAVDKIKVKDSTGKELEVKDNIFYPTENSDILIEVTFTNGEYVPIPDTFLSKSLSLIIIGIILIGLGTYTISYIKSE